MSPFKAKKPKLSERITSYVASDKPLRELAGNISKVAKTAIDEANTLTVEEVTITLDRFPSKLDGLRVVHLSDTHHSPFTDREHISRAVDISNKLEPDIVFLTGDYVSHNADYIAPVAEVLGSLRSQFGTFACLGNHDHWTDADLVTHLLRGEGINVLINEGLRFEARQAVISFEDPLAGESVRFGGYTFPLAADYTVPLAVVLLRGVDNIPVALAIAPAIVVIAAQITASLAWITVSGEDAPELIAAAPVLRQRVEFAKVTAIGLPVLIVLALPLAGLALLSLYVAVMVALFAVAIHQCLDEARWERQHLSV